METRLAFRYGAPGIEPCLKVQSRLADSHKGMFPKRVCLVLLAVVAAMSGGTKSSRASLLRAMSLGELTQTADSIVVGNVVSVSAAWDLQHRRRIAIVQPGGSVGEMEMTVGGMPSFSVGEKLLLFLQGQRRFQVAGMSQGKRGVVWNEASKQWQAEAPDTEDVVEVGPGAKLRQAKRRGPIPLSDLREQVLRAIGNPP